MIQTESASQKCKTNDNQQHSSPQYRTPMAKLWTITRQRIETLGTWTIRIPIFLNCSRTKKLGQIPKDVPKIIVKINHEVLLSAEEAKLFKLHINRQMYIKRIIAICKIKFGSLKL